MMSPRDRIQNSGLYWKIDVQQNLISSLSSHLQVDIRMSSEVIAPYLNEVEEYLSMMNLKVSDVLEEIDAIRELMAKKSDGNLILNLPIILSYHRYAMKKQIEEASREAERAREAQRASSRRRRQF